jgi:hypothetical protein
MLEEMQKAGVKGADTLAANPDYLNRIWKQDRIREPRKHGERGDPRAGREGDPREGADPQALPRAQPRVDR